MIPMLGDEGLLPSGIHRATLPQVDERFGRSSARRAELARRLEHLVSLAQGTAKLRRVFVWGSYVTGKPEPNDVDVMLVMAADFRSEDCEVETQAVFDCQRAENELGATVLWTREDVPLELLQAFTEQWQIGRDGRRHGIVEVIW